MTVTAPAALGAARSVVDSSLMAAIGRLCPGSRSVCRYHLGWRDADGRCLSTGTGKALRPALALCSARAVRADARWAVAGAVAVELVHNSSILHDDVIDGDERRRHQPTAWRLFGEGPAILAGDALLNLAWQVLLESASDHRMEALRRLAHASMEITRGQQADLSFEHRLDVSLEECLDMAAAKTAALISCSAAIGAVLEGGDARTVEGLASFGRHLGLAFQGVDDLIGTWGEPARTGKPTGNDLRQKKKTLPVVFALSCGDPYRSGLREVLSLDVVGNVDVARARGLLERSGAPEWVANLVEQEVVRSLQALDQFPVPGDVRADLEEIARFVATRDA